MIAAIILVISTATLLQFFVSYARSVIAASSKHELSPQAREVSGVLNHDVRGEEFVRLLQLIGLCPVPGGDTNRVRAVSGYFRLLGMAKTLMGRVAPALLRWVETERGSCAYFAAVTLDRRIAFSRELMAQQMSNRI